MLANRLACSFVPFCDYIPKYYQHYITTANILLENELLQVRNLKGSKDLLSLPFFITIRLCFPVSIEKKYNFFAISCGVPTSITLKILNHCRRFNACHFVAC